MEIGPGVHRIEAPLGERMLAVHLCVGRFAVAFDTGTRETPHQTLDPYMESAGIDRSALRLAVITHSDADHHGGNEAIRRLSQGVMIAAHPRDRAMVEQRDTLFSQRYNVGATVGVPQHPDVLSAIADMLGPDQPVDLQVGDGAHIRVSDELDLEIIETPGHTAGHVAAYNEREKILLAGDAVLGAGDRSADGEWQYPAAVMYPTAYRQTVARIRSLRLNLLSTAHLPAMSGSDIEDFLDDSAQFALTLESIVWRSLNLGTARTVRELVDATLEGFRVFPESARPGFVGPVLGVLRDLAHQGRAQRNSSAGQTWQVV